MHRSLKFFFFFLFVSQCCIISFSQPLRVACIGNSVTYGLTHKNPQATSYPSQLQWLLGEKYLVKNFGVSSTTLLKKGHKPYYREDAFTRMLSFAPGIAVIHLGLNDTDPRNWPNYRDELAPDYAWLIDTIRKSNPAVKIFICRLSPIFSDHPRFASGTRDWFWQIQELIPQIAKANHTGLIDFHSPLYSRPDLLPDALHPNEEGAAILAKTVYQKITGDYGGLKLASVFASHMVLQRNKPIKFYGTANAGEKIKAVFNGNYQTVVADDNGKWSVSFPSLKAGGPFAASFSSADKKIVLEDILVGEVWLCSGQSNMDFPLRSAIYGKSEMAAAAKNSTLRFLNREPIAETDDRSWDSVTLEKLNRLQYFSGSWQSCDSSGAKNFSAIAYYFGKKLQEQLKVPVGLIQVAVGGSPTESWIDRYTMEHHPVLANELSNWRTSDFFMPWVKERAAKNLEGASNKRQRHPYEPCYNYEAGIQPFVDFSIAGVIWYQGESNAHNIELHETVFPQLVKSWRKQWGYQFPFYYVQLSSLNRPSWPSFRNSQLQLLKIIPNSGMAVSSDAGHPTDVHPRQKKPVGERLARLALHFTYHQKNVVPCGPMLLEAAKQKQELVLSFQYSGNALKTSDGKNLRGFKLVNEKGIQRETKAYIRQNQVVIPLDKNEDAAELLYGWEPYTDANLVNAEGLPASTFKLKIH
jgi:sialate O-acetylesterase